MFQDSCAAASPYSVGPDKWGNLFDHYGDFFSSSAPLFDAVLDGGCNGNIQRVGHVAATCNQFEWHRPLCTCHSQHSH